VPFIPVIPFAAEANRIEPPVSDPSAPKASPAATAAPDPDPEDDAPAQHCSFQGFFGTSICGWCPE